MNKDTADKKLQEKKRDVVLEKQMHIETSFNPEWNVISSIIGNISNFVVTITDRNDILEPKLCLVNTDSKMLSANKYTWELPYFSALSHNIYFALAWNDYSFSNITDEQLYVIIAHEYFHFLESRYSWFFTEKAISINDENEDLRTIVSESRADFFSWFFLKYCLNESILEENVIKELKNFVWWFSEPISKIRINIQKGVFYSLDWDVHGTSEHRLENFCQGLLRGSFKYLQDVQNFIPEEIYNIDTTKKMYQK